LSFAIVCLSLEDSRFIKNQNIFSGKKKPRPQPGFFAFQEVVASRISNAENTRPQPAATATVTVDVFAGDVHHLASTRTQNFIEYDKRAVSCQAKI
jgi:hypothetical protein